MKENCKNQASIKRYWPGNDPDLVCTDHADDSKRIADAMGFPIVLEPIGYSVSDVSGEFMTCCCSAGFSQKVSVS